MSTAAPTPPPVTFGPGPSRVYDIVRQLLTDAYDSGILAASHRSGQFTALYERTVHLLREKLNIPTDYHVYFLGSATECWNVLTEALVERQALHLYSGDFGRKWFEYARDLRPHVRHLAFDPQHDVLAQLPPDLDPNVFELVAITHNETSNGSQVPAEAIGQLRRQAPQALLAVDATSSMAGVLLPYGAADLWFASVQKCFGLPAGLSVLVASSAAVERMQVVGFRGRYNALSRIHDQALSFQTNFTPNVLGIYLLAGVLEAAQPQAAVDSLIAQRAQRYYAFFDGHDVYKPYIQHLGNRSQTVVCVHAPTPDHIAQAKAHCLKHGLQLGSGYGALKAGTFRIANFPAHTDAEVDALLHALQSL